VTPYPVFFAPSGNSDVLLATIQPLENDTDPMTLEFRVHIRSVLTQQYQNALFSFVLFCP